MLFDTNRDAKKKVIKSLLAGAGRYGGRTRIRTRVFGLEGQSDIQTTLYVLVGCGGSLFKKVTID